MLVKEKKRTPIPMKNRSQALESALVQLQAQSSVVGQPWVLVTLVQKHEVLAKQVLVDREVQSI